MAKKEYSIEITRICLFGEDKKRIKSGTLSELVEYFSYDLDCGSSWSYERGNYKINRNPKSIKSLVSNLNKASHNSSKSYQSTYYSLV